MAIDRKKIIDDLSQIKLIGNEFGIIDGFNGYIQLLPVDFWNGFAEKLTSKVEEDMMEATEYLLVNAAQECGYHTGYGIITSPEWEAVVKPMIENDPEDILYGSFAVLAAWGWAKAEINELIPGEKMVVRAYDYYESDVVTYGKTRKKSAYMLCGISSAFMDLAYGGPYDPTGKTGLRTFKGVQIKGIECGDNYGEFIVTKT